MAEGSERTGTSDGAAQMMVWDGREVGTIGELLDAATGAADAGRAGEFLTAYEQVNEHARANLGYVIGYVEPPERRRALWEAFGLNHPVLGGRP